MTMKTMKKLLLLALSVFLLNTQSVNACGTSLQDRLTGIGFPKTLCANDQGYYPIDINLVESSNTFAVWVSHNIVTGENLWVFQPSLLNIAPNDVANGFKTIDFVWYDTCGTRYTSATLEISCGDETTPPTTTCVTLQDIGFPSEFCTDDTKKYVLNDFNGNIFWSQTASVYTVEDEITKEVDWIFEPSKFEVPTDVNLPAELPLYIAYTDPACGRGVENPIMNPSIILACDDQIYPEGCTDPEAENYLPEAIIEDGSCYYNEDELVTIDTTIIIDRFNSEYIQGDVTDWYLKGNTLHVTWEIYIPNTDYKYQIQIPYEVTVTEGLVLVSLDITYIPTTSFTTHGSRLTSENVTLRRGIRLSKVTGIQEAEISINVYPLPVENRLNLDSKADEITILNTNGIEMINATNANSVDVSSLHQGVYILKVAANGKIFTQTIVK